MRLLLHLSPNTRPVPFDHLHRLTGALHKWLGEANNEHDGLSMYSFGWLRNGQRVKGDSDVADDGFLSFLNGSLWTVSFAEVEPAKRLLSGILDDPEVTCGMKVQQVQFVDTPQFESRQRFFVDGAVLTRANRDDGGRDHLTFENPGSDATLTRTLRRKLIAAGLQSDAKHVMVCFDRSWQRAKSKVVTLKGINYKTSVCPVIVDGSMRAIRFAWLAGVGELTGSGLGALR